MSALSGLKSSSEGIRLDFFFSSQCISNLCQSPLNYIFSNMEKGCLPTFSLLVFTVTKVSTNSVL